MIAITVDLVVGHFKVARVVVRIDAIFNVVVDLVAQDGNAVGFVGIHAKVVVMDLAIFQPTGGAGGRVAKGQAFAPRETTRFAAFPTEIGDFAAQNIHAPAIQRQQIGAAIGKILVNSIGGAIPGSHLDSIDQQVTAPLRGQANGMNGRAFQPQPGDGGVGGFEFGCPIQQHTCLDQPDAIALVDQQIGQALAR